MTFFNSSYTSSFFSLNLQREENSMYMKMQMYSNIVTTKKLSQTVLILKNLCPRVLKTQCFNNYNLPFHKEVQDTEIGHLFEHLLLANLCELCLEHGIKEVTFNGKTSWNWIDEKKGLFHIYIYPVDMVSSLFYKALQKSILITEIVMDSNSTIHKKSRGLQTTQWL